MKEKPKYDKDRKTISLVWDFSPYRLPSELQDERKLSVEEAKRRERFLKMLENLKYSVKIKKKPILKIKFIASPEAWLNADKWLQASQIKFIASPEEGLQGAAWRKSMKKDFDRIRFSDIAPFLSRPHKRSVEALKMLAEEDQDHFAFEFVNCVAAANSENPLYDPETKKSLYGPATKARGGSPYGFDWRTRNKVSIFAFRLHFFIRLMFETPMMKRPEYFKRFCKKYFKDSGHDTGPIPVLESSHVETEIPQTKTEIAEIVAKALSDHFGFKFSSSSYETFVKKRKLTMKFYKHPERIFTPESDPELSEFFAKFQK